MIVAEMEFPVETQTNSTEAEQKENADNKEQRLRSKVLAEILSSEEAYVTQLEQLINGFMKPIKEKELLPKSSYTAIFGDIEPILTLNKALLEELRKSQENVGPALLKIAPYLKLYSSYAHDYELAIKLLQDVRKKQKDFETFISSQERNPEICRKLEALLIVPIQRVPRYRLLLMELISHTDKNHPDMPVLTAALESVELVAKHINEKIREQENMQRMIRIQKSLFQNKPKIVIPGRQLIKEGSLMKVSSDGSSACERYFVLFSDMLMYCKLRSRDITRYDSLMCLCVLPLRHCRAEPVVGNGVFRINCREESLLLYGNSSDEGRLWIEAVNETVQELQANQKTLRRESSSKRPLRRPQMQQQSDSLTRIYQRRLAQQKENGAEPKSRPKSELLTDSPKTRLAEHTEKQNQILSPGKLLKLVGPCPGTVGIPFSPLRTKSCPSDLDKADTPLFYSPPINAEPQHWDYSEENS